MFPNPCSLVSVSSWPCFSMPSSAPIPSVLCILSPILGILLVSLSVRCLPVRSVLGPHPLPSLCPLSPPYLFCLPSGPAPLPWRPILNPLCIFPQPLSMPSRAQAGWGRGGEVAPRAAPPPPPPRRVSPLTFAAPRRHAGGRRRGRDDPESRGQAGPGGGHGRAAPRSSGSARRPRVARSCLSRTPAGAHAAQPHAGTRARRRPGRGRPRTQPIRARAGGTPSPHRGHRPAARAHARPGRPAPGGVGPHATRGPHRTQEASRPRRPWGCPRGRTRDAPPALSLLPM